MRDLSIKGENIQKTRLKLSTHVEKAKLFLLDSEPSNFIFKNIPASIEVRS
jgi:hypothetical protein